MIYLRRLHYKTRPTATGFPFSIPVLKSLDTIEFDNPVTIFVGENGSGKSTLIEAIAIGMDAIAVGSDRVDADPSLDAVRGLASQLRYVKNRKPKRGFFFRAEDFFGFVKRIKSEVQDLKALESEYEQRFSGYAKMITTGMARAQHSELRKRYGDDADAFSHGESFLNLFESRLQAQDLYLLD